MSNSSEIVGLKFLVDFTTSYRNGQISSAVLLAWFFKALSRFFCRLIAKDEWGKNLGLVNKDNMHLATLRLLFGANRWCVTSKYFQTANRCFEVVVSLFSYFIFFIRKSCVNFRLFCFLLGVLFQCFSRQHSIGRDRSWKKHSVETPFFFHESREGPEMGRVNGTLGLWTFSWFRAKFGGYFYVMKLSLISMNSNLIVRFNDLCLLWARIW